MQEIKAKGGRKIIMGFKNKMSGKWLQEKRRMKV